MAKLHEIKARVQEVTGLVAMNENEGISVLVTGDKAHMVPIIAERLTSAGLTYKQSKHRKFKGATFTVLLRNVGTAFAAEWEFV